MADRAGVPEPDDVTLADVVRVLWRRRYVALALFLAAVGGAVAYTVLQDPVYESQATIVAVEQQDVLQHWLESQQAAAWVAERLGDPLLSRLFPDDWSEGAGAWEAQRPDRERAGQKVSDLVEIVVAPRTASQDRSIEVRVAFTDPGLARGIANSYIDSLEVIRPQLQNVTESQLFVQFYDGQNEPDARRQAHQVALEREYWIVVDPAILADAPSSPRVGLNVALGVALGLVLGVLGAFAADWGASYRMSSKAPSLPDAAPPRAAAKPGGAAGGAMGGTGSAGAAGPEPAGGAGGAAFRYRGR